MLKKEEKERNRNIHDLNSDLAKKGIYNNLKKKQIEFWTGVRNEAAHGHEDKYNSQQVEEMLNGVRQFIIDFPA